MYGYRQLGGGPSSFFDTFNRASGGLGRGWAHGSMVDSGVTPIDGSQIAIAVSTGDGGQCITWFTVGPVNPLTFWRGHAIAVDIARKCNGVSQFSELKNIRHDQTAGAAANLYRTGCSVLHTVGGNATKGYFLQAQVTLGNKLWVVSKFTNSNTQVTMAAGAIGSFVNTNLLRLEAVVTPSSVTLRSFVAGVLVDTQVDSAGDRITTGSPGMCSTELGNTAGQVFVSEWRNFAGGRL